MENKISSLSNKDLCLVATNASCELWDDTNAPIYVKVAKKRGLSLEQCLNYQPVRGLLPGELICRTPKDYFKENSPTCGSDCIPARDYSNSIENKIEVLENTIKILKNDLENNEDKIFELNQTIDDLEDQLNK